MNVRIIFDQLKIFTEKKSHILETRVYIEVLVSLH